MNAAGGDSPTSSRNGLVIAIDGPSGSGKSTVSRGVARRLGLRYLDTGAMYRAITWLALERGVGLDDGAALVRLAESADLEIGTDPAAPAFSAVGVDITAAIRSEPVTGAVSAVSAVAGVRADLVSRQRAIIGLGGIVVEGRDIGSVVAPDADIKVFLTASSTTRARRRASETATGDSAAGQDDHLDRTHAALSRRDALDSGRAASPLTRAADAVEIDSTALTVDEVVDKVLALVDNSVRARA